MEVDTGAAVSLISYKRLKQVLPRIKIRKTTVVLRTYTSEVIPVRGEVQVNVTYGEQKKLTLYVTKQEGPSLLGREWLTSIRLDWKTIGPSSYGHHSDAIARVVEALQRSVPR